MERQIGAIVLQKIAGVLVRSQPVHRLGFREFIHAEYQMAGVVVHRRECEILFGYVGDFPALQSFKLEKIETKINGQRNLIKKIDLPKKPLLCDCCKFGRHPNSNTSCNLLSLLNLLQNIPECIDRTCDLPHEAVEKKGSHHQSNTEFSWQRL